VELGDGVGFAGAVAFDEAGVCFLERAVLLLDQQDPAGAVDDDEVDLAVDRVAAVFAAPVDAVGRPPLKRPFPTLNRPWFSGGISRVISMS
jgi:hypothetical protein